MFILYLDKIPGKIKKFAAIQSKKTHTLLSIDI